VRIKHTLCHWFSIAVIVALGSTAACGDDRPYDIVRGQVYVQRESGPLEADVYVPHGKGPFPAMLVVHGGAWASGTREQLAGAAEKLAENGYVAVAISYRLAPKYRFPAQIYDCQAAVRWLRTNAEKFTVDPNRIGGFGYSAGGHLVALLGVLSDDDFREDGVPAEAPSARLEVVLAGGAPCDFRSLPEKSTMLAYWLGGSPAEQPEVYKQASPATYVSADDPPMFFFHGTADELVPIRSPKRMVDELTGAGVKTEFFEVPDAGHMAAAINREALTHAVMFADHYLKSTSADGQ